MTIGRIPSVEGGIQPTIVDAKGDILTATAADTPAVLAVGNNGETLVADSSATTGLRWGANLGFTAGKNKIINGDFGIWQRGTSFSNPSTGSYTADRWLTEVGGNSITQTVSRQTFTPGTAPVSGYESAYFLRNVYSATSPSSNKIMQRIEDVRTLAGQAATISFWAKADTNRTLTLYFDQYFGSGGSASANGLSSTTFSLTTSWQRFTYSGTVASVSGKTIGTSSYLSLEFQLAVSGSTLDLWGVQVEAGSVATAFQTATGQLAGELAACQRYYWRSSAFSGGVSAVHAFGTAEGTGTVGLMVKMPVTMRVTPTAIDYASIRAFDGANLIGTPSSVALITNNSNADQAYVTFNKTSSFTQFRPYFLLNDATTSGYIGFTAEL